MNIYSIYTIIILFFHISNAQGLILYGLNNSANTTDPDTGVPFQSVARLSNGSGTLGGSGVYLGNRYILTANHVGPFSSVTFDGVTHYSHDGALPQQIGSSDMKVFRLTTTPSVAAVTLYSGSSEIDQQGTLVGWGVGRNPTTALNSNMVDWGGSSTSTKRWGLNTPRGAYDDFINGSHTYDIIHTTVGSSNALPTGLGDSEAAATLLDSGSALFQLHSGQWVLAGLTTAVTNLSGASTSTYGNDTSWVFFPNNPANADTQIGFFTGAGDVNIFARISSYDTEITTAIPEPTTAVMSIVSLFLILMRRRSVR